MSVSGEQSSSPCNVVQMTQKLLLPNKRSKRKPKMAGSGQAIIQLWKRDGPPTQTWNEFAVVQRTVHTCLKAARPILGKLKHVFKIRKIVKCACYVVNS